QARRARPGARRQERARAEARDAHRRLARHALDRTGGRSRRRGHGRARDLRELRRGAIEARTGAREDRRGDAQQALLRRTGPDRAAVDPRHGEDGRGRAGRRRRRGARVRAAPTRIVARLEEAATEAPAGRPTFKRILLKLSGEALMGEKEYGLDPARIEEIAAEITEIQQQGVEIALVVG